MRLYLSAPLLFYLFFFLHIVINPILSSLSPAHTHTLFETFETILSFETMRILTLFFVVLCFSFQHSEAHPALGHFHYAYGVPDEAEPRVQSATLDYLRFSARTVPSTVLHHGDDDVYYPVPFAHRYEPEWEKGWRLLRHDDGIKYEGDWFSEEGSGLSRLLPYPICGMKCSGHLCDNKLPIFVMPNRRAPLFPHVSTWTPWTSESDAEFHGIHNVAHCPKGEFAIQIQCWGAYCKSMRLGCSKLRSEFRAQYQVDRYQNADKDDTNLNAPFSNEAGGTGYCPDGEYLDGIQCSSWFCNYIRLFCSRIQIATN